MDGLIGFIILSIVALAFGLLTGIEFAQIKYTKLLAMYAKRCIHSGTIAPILVELQKVSKK